MAKRSKRVEYRDLSCGDRKLTGVARVHGLIEKDIYFTYDYSGTAASLTVETRGMEEGIGYKKLAHSLKAIAQDLVR